MVATMDLTKLKEGLNEGQSEGFDKITNFLNDFTSNKIFVLRGYAGTGKTFLSSRIIDYINLTNKTASIGVSALTNKALKVIGENINSSKKGIILKTAYQLLGLTEKIDRLGNRTFERDKKVKHIDIDYISYLFVDEVSMLNDEIFWKLHKYCPTIKIIFMGDPAQIPPVGKEDCIPFDDSMSHMFETYSLTTIMRQKLDNPIISLAFNVRSKLEVVDPNPLMVTQLNKQNHGVFVIDALKDKHHFKPLLNEYFNSEEFRKDPNFVKVIAWRRDSVNYVNSLIRHMIYPIEDYEFDLVEHGNILPGEKLIANSPVFSSGEKVMFNTSDEFEVEAVVIGKHYLRSCIPNSKSIELKTYRCMVKGININGPYKKNIQILHEDSQVDYNNELIALKDRALKSSGKYNYWLNYYSLQREFADVAYNYAITAHKAQGSTYNNVFFIESDVNMNPNIRERNRIKYTSYTRSSEKLFIYK